MTYRPDIEGLRAVAVALVVAAHAKVGGLAGGFVGVDVFFVLSGYLITGLLAHELAARGQIDFAAFYARRFRRLFPSLLVVLVCSCVLGQQLLAIGDQPEQAMAVASAAAWLSNFYFAFASQDYFGHAAESNLFLHTWSLGVEEQFYLLWPALMLLLARTAGTAGAKVNVGRLKVAMPLIAAIGFAGCLAWTTTHPLLAFYMMPARAWQFALGASAFLYVSAESAPGGNPGLLRWSGWLGLGAILAAALLLDGKQTYPGAWAALPSLGAAAVLASGARQPHGGVGRLLSLQPMQRLGRVSYVWYLWHWPILLLGAAVFDFARPEVRACLALLSLALAFATHVLVESPLRDRARFPIPAAHVLFATILAIIMASALAIEWQNRAQQEAHDARQRPLEQARFDIPPIYMMGCDDWYRSDAVRVCEFGSGKAGKTVVAMGDSVGLQWFPTIEAAFVPRDWRLLVVTKSSCPMVDEPFFYARIGRRYEECERWRAAALKLVADVRPELVIMGSAYAYDFDEAQWREGTRRVLKAIAGSTGRVYILRSTPTLPFDALSCLAPRGWLYEQLADPERCSAPVNGGRRDDVHRWLQAAAGTFDNAGILDMTDAVCPGGICRAQRDGFFVFRDNHHLSATFARSLGAEMARRIEPERPASRGPRVPGSPGG